MAQERQKRKFTDTKQWKILRPVLIVVVSLVVVLIVVLSVINYVETNYFSPVDPDSTDVVEVEIPKSSSLADISEILENNKLIRSKTCFKLYADFSDVSYKLKAGRYNLSPSMTYDDIIYTIMKGNPPATEVKFTFIEGITVVAEGKQLSDAENGGIYKSPDRFYELCRDGAKFKRKQMLKECVTPRLRKITSSHGSLPVCHKIHCYTIV